MSVLRSVVQNQALSASHQNGASALDLKDRSVVGICDPGELQATACEQLSLFYRATIRILRKSSIRILLPPGFADSNQVCGLRIQRNPKLLSFSRAPLKA